MLRNGALGMALHAFFDETGTHAGHPLTAVAGFLFDEKGVNSFDLSWQKRTSDLTEPFHTYDCFHGFGQFEGWPKPQRLLLMHDLADLVIQTRLCGFIAFVEANDYDQWRNGNPQYVSWIGSPYTVCLMKCVETVGIIASQNKLEGNISYLFESGCDKQPEASQFMLKLEKNPLLKAGLKVERYGFAPKSSDPALCAADFLCWEWQRNFIENPTWDLVTSEFKSLISPNPTEMYIQKITKDHLSSQAVTNAAHGLHPD